MSMQQMLTEFTEVTPTLFIASATAITENKLKEAGITVIINATKELLDFPTEVETIHRVRVPIYDNSDATLFPYFKPICDLIDANEKVGGKTLVHCLAGRSRSASICIAYLILKKKLEPLISTTKANWITRSKDLYDCLDDLKRRRPLVQPNSNFMRQLVRWDQEISKPDQEPYNAFDFFSYQMNKSERVHLEAIQLIESTTLSIIKFHDNNGNIQNQESFFIL